MTIPATTRAKLGRRIYRGIAVAAAVCMLSPGAAVADQSETTDPLRIERIERQLQELRSEIAELAASRGPSEQASTAELERRIAILAEEIERLQIGEAAASADESDWGMGPAASKIYRTETGVSIGGYGEMLYQNYSDELEDGSPSGATDELDFVRAIIYAGYKFNDRFLFNSEIEFEHASTDKSGSASVEFAYIDYLWRPELNLRAGLLLVPMGFVNELHEPTTFFGAQRPETEQRIIPSTWRENGFGVFGEKGSFSYRSYLVNGLKASGFDSSGLRGGRQKGSKAAAEDFAWVGRLDYSQPGLVAGGSLYVGNSGQGIGDGLGVGTTIVEGHIDFNYRGLRLRGLAAKAHLDDAAELNGALGLEGSDSVGKDLFGAYIEAGYDLLSLTTSSSASLSPFVRWETIDTQDEVPTGFASKGSRDRELITVGVHYMPIDQVVLKLDWRTESNRSETGRDQVNIGLGYIF